MSCHCIRIVTIAFGLLAFSLGAALAGAGEGAPDGQPAAGSEAPAPVSRAPLKVNTIDFKEGKLILGGIAIPGSEITLFFDDAPLGRVTPEASGKWNFEGPATFGEGRHTLRADQYDVKTNMLAARAVMTIGRPEAAPGGAAPAGAAPAEKSPN